LKAQGTRKKELATAASRKLQATCPFSPVVLNLAPSRFQLDACGLQHIFASL